MMIEVMTMVDGGETPLTLQDFRPNIQWKEELGRSVQKIAVLRVNTLGDFIFALPALQSLRNSYRKAEIVLLGRQWHADFLKDRPSPLDRVVVVPPVRGVNNPPEKDDDPGVVQQFIEQMVGERFDLGIQVHGDGRYSNPVRTGCEHNPSYMDDISTVEVISSALDLLAQEPAIYRPALPDDVAWAHLPGRQKWNNQKGE